MVHHAIIETNTDCFLTTGRISDGFQMFTAPSLLPEHTTIMTMLSMSLCGVATQDWGMLKPLVMTSTFREALYLTR